MEVTKREGDYKEVPYYLIKDLNTFGTIIREMVVTNKAYDIGFPYRIIRTSNYMRSMRDIFKEAFMEYMHKLFAEFQFDSGGLCLTGPPITKRIKIPTGGFKELHFLNFNEEKPIVKDRRVSKKLLEELELWWLRYSLTMLCSQDPIDVKKVRKMLEEEMPEDYILGDDIWDVIKEEINK